MAVSTPILIKTPIRAVDLLARLPAPGPAYAPVTDAQMSPTHDGLLISLFGMIPDYSNPDLDALYDETFEEDETALFDECRRHGIEVLGDDGTPVPPWRDILVVLRAVDRGILERRA